MTLVELLVVVTVILVMLAVSVPALAPSIRENRIREGSRQMNVMVARAKARAGELGRRVALWLERSGPGSNAVMDVYLAEAPSEYSGDLQGARCTLFYDPSWRFGVGHWDLIRMRSSLTTPQGTALVRPGENFKIRFDGRGVWYDGYRDASNGLFYLRPPLAVIRPTGAVPPDKFIPPIGFYDPGVDGNWGMQESTTT